MPVELGLFCAWGPPWEECRPTSPNHHAVEGVHPTGESRVHTSRAAYARGTAIRGWA